MAPLCAAVIVAHFYGYRLIGLIHLIPNDLELGNDVVVAFGPGNLVTLADGRSFHLSGVRPAQDIHLDRFDLANHDKPTASVEPSATTNTGYPWAQLLRRLTNGIAVDSPRRDYYLSLPSTGLPARVRPIDAQHAVIEVPIEYRPYYNRCLMSFDEQWFPPRVPRYRTIDLATALLGSGVIEPDDSEHYV